MTDREQVIKGLECCNMPNNHDDCPYNGAAHYNICTHQLLTDALALLKEQEAVKPILKREGRNKYYNDYVCSECGNELDYGQNFCSGCGKAVKWE